MGEGGVVCGFRGLQVHVHCVAPCVGYCWSSFVVCVAQFTDYGFIPGSHVDGLGFGEQLFFLFTFPDEPCDHHVWTDLLACFYVSPESGVLAPFMLHPVEEHLVDVFRYLCIYGVVS